MKLLLICQGGMSTSILMNKMKKYAIDHDIPLEVKATSVSEYQDVSADYDALLVGPQAAYRLNEIKEVSGKPAGSMAPVDYGIGNVENILKQAQGLLDQK